MAFEGDLKNLPLADVLQSIHQNNLTGTLSVKDTKGERRVAFSAGFIVAFQPAPGDGHPVIDALAKRRIVAKNEAEKARSGFLGKRKTLRMALAQRGLVKEEDYQKVVKEDVLEGIYELFLELDRTFKFEDGAPDLANWDQDQVCAELRIPAPGIVMEGARRTDEWQRIRRAIGSFHEVLVRDSETPEEDDDNITKEIIGLADGTRDLQSILDQLPVPKFKGCEAASALIANRRLRPASPNEYVNLGQRAEERGDFEEAATFYERGLSTERGNYELRRRRANALERCNRKADAAQERKLLAQALLDQGKKADAATELLKAADLEPRDPHPLEQRLKLAHEDQDKDAVRVVSARLAALYEDLGLGEKARDLLRAEATHAPDDEELREKIGELLLRQGDNKGAAKEWRDLAGNAARRENLSVAAARYRRAVEVDPGDETSRAALKDIETGEVVARRVRRRQRVRFAGITAVLVAFAAWVFWEGEGLHYLHEAEVSNVLERVSEGSPEGLADAMASMTGLVSGESRFRYTLMARSQAEAITFKLVELYARSFERASKEPILPPAGKKFLSQDDAISLLGKAIDPPSEPTLEELCISADNLLATDRPAAGKSFDEVLARVGKARAVLAQTSAATMHKDEIEKQVKRLTPVLARARVGRVRALNLDEKSRDELEKLVRANLPPVELPKK